MTRIPTRIFTAFFLPAFALTLLLSVAAAPAFANALPQFADLAEKTGAAVVNISTKQKAEKRGMEDFRRNHPPGGPFKDFFDQFEKHFKKQRPRKVQSLGSGFIISKDGYIVTNNHVVEHADEVKVSLQGEDKPYDAKIIGRDPETDLAVLKIKAKKALPVLKFADSAKSRVGDWVLAIGNPFGLDHTITAGIISAKGRVIGAGAYDDFIQTDASINPGNSGGPLINMDGEVIGINTAIVASGQGIGFAVPSSMAKTIIAELKDHKQVKRGWLGVSIQNIDADTARALGLDDTAGALVANVTPGDPADKAGVKTGDVILAVNGDDIEDASDLTHTVAKLEPGAAAKLTIWRKGKTRSISVKLGLRDTAKLTGDAPRHAPASHAVLGVLARPVEKNEAKALGLDKAEGLLVVNVEEDSSAAESGINPGDVIVEVNQSPVDTVSEFENIVNNEGKDKGVVMLLVKRKGQNFFRTLRVE